MVVALGGNADVTGTEAVVEVVHGCGVVLWFLRLPQSEMFFKELLFSKLL